MERLRGSRADFLSWAHFGDLHISEAYEENHLDFLEMIDEANEHLTDKVDFAFLPGDNADDGTEEQYQLVRSALDRLKLPVQVVTGDHDKKAGTLDLFTQYLDKDLYRALTIRGFRLLFLNAMDGMTSDAFDIGSKQLEWIESELTGARAAKLRPLIFTHLYPSELSTQAESFGRLIRDFQVEVVDMGHTHYNELANDGLTIYAATRSTGQIEEGPPGFSITTIDGNVVSWKFKKLGPWPFVMITSPADEKMITRPESPSQVVRGTVSIRGTVWGGTNIQGMTCSIDNGPRRAMFGNVGFASGEWSLNWDSRDVPDGAHRIVLRAEVEGNGRATDEICVVVNQAGVYTSPKHSSIDFENTIGAHPGKGILGTQLGPTENGTKGPWPSWRGR